MSSFEERIMKKMEQQMAEQIQADAQAIEQLKVELAQTLEQFKVEQLETLKEQVKELETLKEQVKELEPLKEQFKELKPLKEQVKQLQVDGIYLARREAVKVTERRLNRNLRPIMIPYSLDVETIFQTRANQLMFLPNEKWLLRDMALTFEASYYGRIPRTDFSTLVTTKEAFLSVFQTVFPRHTLDVTQLYNAVQFINALAGVAKQLALQGNAVARRALDEDID